MLTWKHGVHPIGAHDDLFQRKPYDGPKKKKKPFGP